MKQDIKEKWINALMSGEYSQARNALRYRDGYCCLGVLCDLFRKETGKGSWRPMNSSSWAFEFIDEDGSPSIAYLPTGVMVWAGLHSSNPVVSAFGEEYFRSLGHLNDNGLMSFVEIAQRIESGL